MLISKVRSHFALLVTLLLCSLHCLCLASTPDASLELIETTYVIHDDSSCDLTIHQRWKANNAQGRAEITQLHIAYQAGSDVAGFNWLKTIKKDGSVVQADPKSAFDTMPAQDPLLPMFTDMRSKTILAPNVDTGDEVEYEAVLHTRQFQKPGEFWLVHYLSKVAADSEIVVLDLPASRRVAFHESKAGKVEVSNGRHVERWMHTHSEGAQLSADFPEPLFAVSSMTSWDEFGSWMRSLNDAAQQPTPEISALAAKLTAGKTSEREKIAALYGYVATKIRYISVSFDIGRIQPHRASDVLHNSYGDCKDQTALVIALLSASGFKAHAVLTTPGAGVLEPDVPTILQFIHEFVAVETKTGELFLDPALGPAPPGVLSPGVRGRSSVMIKDSGASIVDIPVQSNVPMNVSLKLKAKVNAEGVFEGSLQSEFQGISEAFIRRVFLDGSNSDKENILRVLAGPEFQNAVVRQISSSDPLDLSKPFQAECELSDPKFFEPGKSRKRITFDLPLGQFLDLIAKFKKPAKPLPVDAVTSSRSMDLIVDTSLAISNGMPVHLKTAFGQFDSEFSYEKGHLLLSRSISTNGASIAPSQWDAFVDFLRSAQQEVSRGFDLERHAITNFTGLSESTRLVQLGGEAYRKHDYAAARRYYEEETALNPKDGFAWNNLGRTYAALHEFEKAESAYKRQIEINPKDEYTYNNLGMLYRAMHRDDEAIKNFRKQIEVHPRDMYAHENLSVALVAKGDWETARAEAQIAVDISPEDPSKWLQLARTQLRTGHAQEAVKTCDRALALPHDAVLENNVAYILADKGLELNKAWRLASGALEAEARHACEPEELSKDNKCATQMFLMAMFLDTNGWILYKQGKTQESEPYIKASHAIQPRPEIELHLAEVLATLGRIDDAVKYFAAAQTRPDYKRFDTAKIRQTLSKALGGEHKLDARVKRLEPQQALAKAEATVIVLVDSKGKVLDAMGGNDATPEPLVQQAKTLEPISWPGYALKSLRTISYRLEGEHWQEYSTRVSPKGKAAASTSDAPSQEDTDTDK